MLNTYEYKNPNNKLKELRLKFYMKQSEVAKCLNMHCEDRICRWEKGLAAPSLDDLFKLAKIYRVLPHELYPDFVSSISLPDEGVK